MFDTDRLRLAFDFDFEEAVIAQEEMICTRRCPACGTVHPVIRRGCVRGWPRILTVVHERIDVARSAAWPKELRIVARNGEQLLYALRSWVVRIGPDPDHGHCFAFVRTAAGLRKHDDSLEPVLIPEPAGDDIVDQIRLGYYEKVMRDE